MLRRNMSIPSHLVSILGPLSPGQLLPGIGGNNNMRTRIAALAAASAFAITLASVAASAADEARETYVYASYFNCSAGMRADDAVNKLYKGVLDGAVKDGTVGSWGWMARHTGGNWSRIGYYSGSSLKALFAAQAELNKRWGGKDNQQVNEQFGQACQLSEDYIWRAAAGNVGTTRGDAGFSVYYICDSSREDQADALITRVFAPMYDKMVADGQITSWGWLEHIIGGEYRRLATFTAVDNAALLEARGAINKLMMDDPLADAFTDICGSHADYIWNVVAKAP